METWEIIVKGKVQGVWYRASTREKAMELGINGWVRNEPDGAVYIVAQGRADKLTEFEDWCYEGPQFAKVSEVLVRKARNDEDYNDFEIIR